MNYFSAYLPLLLEDDCDRSYPSPEEQLLRRLDDLCDVRDILVEEGASWGYDYCLSDDDIRYCIPESLAKFRSISMVERAIELAKDDLVNRYDLPEPDEYMCAEQERTDVINARQYLIDEYLTKVA